MKGGGATCLGVARGHVAAGRDAASGALSHSPADGAPAGALGRSLRRPRAPDPRRGHAGRGSRAASSPGTRCGTSHVPAAPG
ncbi:hypothetical protein ACFPRL_28550 [Pseudoclavibacter helvolus]